MAAEHNDLPWPEGPPRARTRQPINALGTLRRERETSDSSKPPFKRRTGNVLDGPIPPLDIARLIQPLRFPRRGSSWLDTPDETWLNLIVVLTGETNTLRWTLSAGRARWAWR